MSSLWLVLALSALPASPWITPTPTAQVAAWSYFDYTRLRHMRDVAPHLHRGWRSVRDEQGIIDDPTAV
jgi:hypothetical protein